MLVELDDNGNVNINTIRKWLILNVKGMTNRILKKKKVIKLTIRYKIPIVV